MKQSVITSEIKASSYLSLAILIVVFWGFYRTYFMFFPTFENFLPVQHFHGIASLLWMICLIAQPLLIVNKKHDAHKIIGKFSYLLAPLVAVSILMVSRMGYLRGIDSKVPAVDAIAGLALNIPLLFGFVLFYSLAVVNKTHTYAHMRYMIGTALLMIGPGLGRAFLMYFKMPFGPAVLYVNLISIALASTFLVIDIVKKNSIVPNVVVTLTLISTSLAWEFRYGGLWQAFGKLFSQLY